MDTGPQHFGDGESKQPLPFWRLLLRLVFQSLMALQAVALLALTRFYLR